LASGRGASTQGMLGFKALARYVSCIGARVAKQLLKSNSIHSDLLWSLRMQIEFQAEKSY
jgi:hypothetical protein